MWDLWWTKWHWNRFFSEYFGFPLSISFLGKGQKIIIIIVIFIIGLHRKPQGCGASVASAAGPFTAKIPYHIVQKFLNIREQLKTFGDIQ
jgi:hypothetical protein